MYMAMCVKLFGDATGALREQICERGRLEGEHGAQKRAPDLPLHCGHRSYTDRRYRLRVSHVERTFPHQRSSNSM